MARFQHLEAVLDEITDKIVAAVAKRERIRPEPLRLLLRRYATGARPDVAEPLGDAFAREMDRQTREGIDDDPTGWLSVFAEAVGVSDDSRLAVTATPLIRLVRARWSAPAVVDAVRSIESCLLAGAIPDGRAAIADAVDSLERVIGAAYRPGAGISHLVTQPSNGEFVAGNLGDHAATASTLLTAYAISGRLPYAMLADELMQLIRHRTDEGPRDARCDAVRVHCRLALLHQEPEYRQSAVLPPGADYAAEAARVLAVLVETSGTRDEDDAPLGLALTEWLGLPQP